MEPFFLLRNLRITLNLKKEQINTEYSYKNYDHTIILSGKNINLS